MATDLPNLPAGVWRHYKGHFYLVLGYGHDANVIDGDTYGDGDLGEWSDEAYEWLALDERTVVVYVGLELTDAHTGPRLAVRTAEDFHAHVCTRKEHTHYGKAVTDVMERAVCAAVPRFAYVGPSWEGSRG